MTKIKTKTEAALINHLGAVVGLVTTSQASGRCRYFYFTTIDGTPVNVCPGKLSRSRISLADAEQCEVSRNIDDPTPKLCRSADSYAAE